MPPYVFYLNGEQYILHPENKMENTPERIETPSGIIATEKAFEDLALYFDNSDLPSSRLGMLEEVLASLEVFAIAA